ncbi:MAG: hypothetical protein AAGJ51_08320 [Pseudomonadota bacterium]
MTPDARLCLQKTWPLIERLVIEINLLVSLITPLAQAEHLKVLRLVRLAEGLMRRWLVLSACARPLKAPARGAGPFTGVSPGAERGLGMPLFRLADPEPKSQAAPGVDAPAEPFRILALQDDPLVPVHCAPVCNSEEILNSFPTPIPTPSRAEIRLWERSKALLGAMREPDKHIARMRRFLAKSLSGLGPFPLRLHRPWGQSAKERRARPEAYAALKDLRMFTRDALIALMAPG